jgi:hypothetical protein
MVLFKQYKDILVIKINPMRYITFALLIYVSTAFCQSRNTQQKLEEYIHRNHISLNKPSKLLKGYKLYYNCDSMAFMKKVDKNKIFIMTPASSTPMTLEEFIPETKRKDFGQYEFPTSFEDDGRIDVVDYQITTFLFRNDSLYELNAVTDFPGREFDSLLNIYVSHKIDSIEFDKETKALNKRYKKQLVSKFKLIFHPSMFNNNDTIALDESVNFRKSTIILQKKWKAKDKTCYNILIKENWHGMDLEYSYSFDQDIRFVLWEGCDNN